MKHTSDNGRPIDVNVNGAKFRATFKTWSVIGDSESTDPVAVFERDDGTFGVAWLCDFKFADTEDKSVSIPEPPPSSGIANVPQALIGWILRASIDDELTNASDDGCWGKAIELVNERDAFGRAKYKMPLMTHNGRNMIEDARQELGDAMQYIHGAKMEGLDLSAIRPLIEVLRLMVGD